MIYGKHQSGDIAPEKKLILLVYFVILAACLLKGNINQDFASKWLSIKWLWEVGWVNASWFYVEASVKSLLASFPDLIQADVSTASQVEEMIASIFIKTITDNNFHVRKIQAIFVLTILILLIQEW